MSLEVDDLTITLVEPSTTQAKIIIAELVKAGVFKIDHCTTAADTLSHLKTSIPDLLISSMHLPDMTATQMINTIRRIPAMASVNFMLVSSETSYQLIDPVKQAGVVAILPKPFDSKDLNNALIAVRDLIEGTQLENVIDVDDLKCLVVDDSLTARKHVIKLLNSVGIENVTEAINGKDAITKLETSNFDFVLSDYNMPEMNGRELVEFIQNSEFSYLPVLMITSEQDGSKLNAVRQAGVSALMDKAMDGASLKSVLSNVLADH